MEILKPVPHVLYYFQSNIAFRIYVYVYILAKIYTYIYQLSQEYQYFHKKA